MFNFVRQTTTKARNVNNTHETITTKLNEIRKHNLTMQKTTTFRIEGKKIFFMGIEHIFYKVHPTFNTVLSNSRFLKGGGGGLLMLFGERVRGGKVSFH